METLARLTYNIERRAQARARAVSRRKDKAHGDTKSGDTGKKGLRPRAPKKAKISRLSSGDLGEIIAQDLTKEIKGTGGVGPGELRFASTPAIHDFPGISGSIRQRIPHISDIEYARLVDTPIRKYQAGDRSQLDILRDNLTRLGFWRS